MMIAAANQVLNVYSMANAGNSVFNAQMPANGPITTKNTISMMAMTKIIVLRMVCLLFSDQTL